MLRKLVQILERDSIRSISQESSPAVCDPYEPALNTFEGAGLRKVGGRPGKAIGE
jgi:hypothetical protein